jgi:hypothetical protein
MDSLKLPQIFLGKEVGPGGQDLGQLDKAYAQIKDGLLERGWIQGT